MESWQKIIKISSVDSTNIYFSNLLKESEYTEGSIVSALFQSKGKGLGQNSWESEKGKNLIFSLVLYPEFLPLEKNFVLSKAISLGIVNYLNTKTNHIKIKWPNDIYFRDQKIAGILIENSIKGSNINRSIIGIGLNLNQKSFLSNAPNPVSLTQITEKNYSIDQETVKLRHNIRFFYDKLKAGKLEDINKEYLKCLYRFNEIHPFKTENETFKGQIKGVNEFGHLQVLTEDQRNLEFDFKEIEFILP